MNNGNFKELTVGQVNEYIKMVFDSDPILTNVRIKGEISNFKYYPSSGHMYFSLKDETAVIKAVMFKSSAMTLKFVPKNGMKVVAAGKISAYPRDGVYQLYCSSMKEEGAGSLFEALEELKKKLSAMGLFAIEHKRPLPPYPQTVGIVTSIKGAALRDMLNILKRRNPGVEVVIYPAAVQGNGAWRELKAGIEYFSATKRADVVIIGRGGGAYEDLWEFNNEELAKAIYNSSVPVVSAVGHETDFTICDMVADTRAPTPSAGAELVVATTEEIKSGLNKWEGQAKKHLEDLLRYKKTVLEGYQGKLSALGDHFVAAKKKELESVVLLLGGKVNSCIERKTMELISASSSLEALNPLSILSRGFAYVCRSSTGENIHSVDRIKTGERVKVRLNSGSFTAVVEEIINE